MWEGARRCLLCDQDRRNLRPATLDLRGDPVNSASWPRSSTTTSTFSRAGKLDGVKPVVCV
jgi:hypothetical protein